MIYPSLMSGYFVLLTDSLGQKYKNYYNTIVKLNTVFSLDRQHLKILLSYKTTMYVLSRERELVQPVLLLSCVI